MLWENENIMSAKALLGHLRAIRKQQGLTLAKAASLTGLNLSQISQIENGNVDPRLSSILALAGSLNMSVVLVPREASAHIGPHVGPHVGAMPAAEPAQTTMAASEPQASVDRLRVPAFLVRR